MKHILTLLTALLLAPPAALHAADFYAATNGSDRNPGTKDKPFKTISASIYKLNAGDTLLLGKGVYHEAIKVFSKSGSPGQPITIAAEENGTVTVRGSVPVTGWLRSQGAQPVYIHDTWTYYFGNLDLSQPNPPREKDARDKPRNLLFCEGEYIPEVFYPDSLKEHSFFVDKTHQRILLWLQNGDDPGKKLIEVADLETLAYFGNCNYFVIRGIRFERGANSDQEPLVVVRGNNCLVEDCSMSQASAAGFGTYGSNTIVRRCVFNNNGQEGCNIFRTVNCRLEDCESSYNNNTPDKKFSHEYSCGGGKVLLNYGLVIARMKAQYNNGPGIWLDWSNNESTISNCLCTDNKGAGIFCEVQYGVHIHDNVLIGNTPHGIHLAESDGPVFERNLVIGSTYGLTFRDLDRKAPGLDANGVPDMSLNWGKWVPRWNQDLVIKNNVMAFNQNNQVIMSFSERMMPLALQKVRQPDGLSLETLNIKVDNNIYWAEAVEV